MQVDDQALLVQIIQGDQEALKHLYARYREPVYRYLWYQLERNTGWTEEIVQDVFLNIWRSAAQYRGEARLATWIFRIAHHLAAKARRDRSRRAEGHLIELEAGDDEGAGISEEHVFFVNSHEEGVLNRLTLTDALQQLSPRHRTVLELVFLQGFSPAEVAQVLDVPVGTVKSRISYARRALLALLQQSDALEGVGHDK